MDQKAQGYILAFGVGVLTFACCEMAAKVAQTSKAGEWDRYTQRMFLFVLGVTIIGLTMMCESEMERERRERCCCCIFLHDGSISQLQPLPRL